jgi:hypothetical protein
MACPTCRSLHPERRGMFYDGPCEDTWHAQATYLVPMPPGPVGTGHDPADGKAPPLLMGWGLAEPLRDKAITGGL